MNKITVIVKAAAFNAAVLCVLYLAFCVNEYIGRLSFIYSIFATAFEGLIILAAIVGLLLMIEHGRFAVLTKRYGLKFTRVRMRQLLFGLVFGFLVWLLNYVLVGQESIITTARASGIDLSLSKIIISVLAHTFMIAVIALWLQSYAQVIIHTEYSKFVTAIILFLIAVAWRVILEFLLGQQGDFTRAIIDAPRYLPIIILITYLFLDTGSVWFGFGWLAGFITIYQCFTGAITLLAFINLSWLVVDYRTTLILTMTWLVWMIAHNRVKSSLDGC